MIFGCDIASYQGSPDFQKMWDDGHRFVISKLTGEGSYINPFCLPNLARARAVGHVVGTYDWTEPQSWANDDDGRAAARDYLAHMDLHASDLITVDFETPAWNTGPLGTNIESAMRAYMETLYETTQTKIGLYSGPYFLNETGAINWAWLGDATRYYYWEAAPGGGMLADDSGWPATTTPFATVTVHQHQWYATDAGIVGQFDRDRFQGTREELMAYGYQGQIQAAVVSGGIVQTPVPPDPAAAISAALPPAPQPSAETISVTITPAGETVMTINFGGQASAVDGYVIADAGVTVTNAQGEKFSRSVQQNVLQGWHQP